MYFWERHLGAIGFDRILWDEWAQRGSGFAVDIANVGGWVADFFDFQLPYPCLRQDGLGRAHAECDRAWLRPLSRIPSISISIEPLLFPLYSLLFTFNSVLFILPLAAKPL